MSKDGGAAKRFVLLGTDYVYPRTTNKILRAFLHSQGHHRRRHHGGVHAVRPRRLPDDHRARSRSSPSEGKKTAVVSTINGDSNVPFYKELGNQGLKATDVPVVAFSVGEEELRGVDTKPLVGHLAAWNYFMSIKNPTNDRVHQEVELTTPRPKNIAGHKDKPLTNDPMEATYIGIHMWAQAVEKAKSTDTDKVIAAMAGQTFKAPGGFTSTMDPKNHHLHKPVFIGEIKSRRPVQRRVEDAGPGQGPAVEPVHPENEGQEGRAREEVSRSSAVHPEEAKDSTAAVRISLLAALVLLVRRGLADVALTPQQALAIAAGDNDARIAALNAAVAAAMRSSPRFVQALLDDEVKVAGDKVFIVHDGKTTDAASGAAGVACPRRAEDVTNNNRMRGALDAVLSHACAVLARRRRCGGARSTSSARRRSTNRQLPLVEKALAAETDAGAEGTRSSACAPTILVSVVGPRQAARRRRGARDEQPERGREPAAGAARRAGGETDAEVRAALQQALVAVRGAPRPGASGSASSSPASASARCCCWSRSAWRSPTA